MNLSETYEGVAVTSTIPAPDRLVDEPQNVYAFIVSDAAVQMPGEVEHRDGGRSFLPTTRNLWT